MVIRAMPMRTTAWTTLLVAIAVAGCSRSHDGPDAGDACCDAGPADAGSDAGVERDAAPDAPPPCVPSEELCNGADDDCDGTIDEAPAELDCSVANGTAACEDGACAVAECDFGFSDCDADLANGCETETETDAASCGACGRACPEGVACHDGVCDDERIVAISAGEYHACAVRQSGEALCWGNNQYGQLGTGDNTPRVTATPVVGSGDYIDVVAATVLSCALTRDGAVECWGDNARGSLGDGTRIARWTPAPAVGISAITRIASGAYGNAYVLALDSSGRLWGWGNNYYGQLGPTAALEAAFPTPFETGIAGVRDVDAAAGHACAVFDDKSVDCWGAAYAEPTSVHAEMLWARAWTGQLHACGLDESGGLYCWGGNGHGEVGPFACDPCPSPQLVDLGDRIIAAAPGAGRTCALTASGGVHCWGVGGDVASGTPTAIGGIDHAIRLASTYTLTCALDDRARVWCWNGRIVGDGTESPRWSPTEVRGLYR